MEEYHKINSVYARNKEGYMLLGQYSDPAFEFLKDCPWVFTEKVDGTNIRVMFDGDRLSFGGRTDAAQIPATLFQRLTDLLVSQTDIFKEKLSGGACLYGEGYGPKIQKGGGNYGASQDFVLFDVMVGTWWLKREDVEDIASAMGLRVVPILREDTLAKMEQMCRDGFMSTWGNFQAEGIVARPKIDLFNRRGERVITKLKHKDFQRLAVVA